MKKQFTILSAAVCTALQAQFQPFELFMYNDCWQMNGYDSVSFYLGDKLASNAQGKYNYVWNGNMLQSMSYHDEGTNQEVYSHQGSRQQNIHSVISYYNPFGQLQPYERTRFELNSVGNPATVYVDYNDGVGFVPGSRFEMDYTPFGRIAGIHSFYADSGSFTYSGSMIYHYSSTRLDSIQINLSGISESVGKYEFCYWPDGELQAMEIFDRSGLNGEMIAVSRYEFTYDNDLITLQYFAFFHNTKTWELLETYEYHFNNQNPVGMEDKVLSSTTVYPNPVADILNIETAGATKYYLLNRGGQLLKNGEVEKSIDVSSVDPGHYILLLEFENGSRESVAILKK